MDLPEMVPHPRPAYAAAFARMVWAFPFLGLTLGPTITVGGEQFSIDLLPDFVGYLLIASAANRLLPLGRPARVVRNLSLVLTFLTIPSCIQYRVAAAKAEEVMSLLSPFLAVGLVVAGLDMVLVWLLCGLVADLARHGGARRTEASALSRRNFYVVLKALFAGGLLGLPLLPPGLLVAAVVVGLVLAVTIMALLMGLMKQAEQVCGAGLETAPEVEPGAGPSRLARALTALGVLLPLVLAAGAFTYYSRWTRARDDLRRAQGHNGPDRLHREFLDAVRARRLDDAYAITSAGYKARVSREQFAERAEKYIAFKTPPNRRDSGGSGSSIGSGDDSFVSSEYEVDGEGRTTTVTVKVGREKDSLFHLRPPPLVVSEFTVEEGGPANRGIDPFGGNPFPGK